MSTLTDALTSGGSPKAPDLGRRRWLLATAALLGGCGGAPALAPYPLAAPAAAGPMSPERRAALSPDGALSLLRTGNDRFALGRPARHDPSLTVRSMAVAANPFAAIVCCSDAPLVPEAVFDQSFGDLVTIRTFGNAVDGDVLGSAEYAVHVAGAKLLVVLGHAPCEATLAAIDELASGRLDGPAAPMEPLVRALSPEGIPAGRARLALARDLEAARVGQTVRAIVDGSPALRGLLASRAIALVGALYDTRTRTVDFSPV